MTNSKLLYDSLIGNFSRDEIVKTICDVVSIPSVNPYDETPSAGNREREMGLKLVLVEDALTSD